jgi:hypothetical protein
VLLGHLLWETISGLLKKLSIVQMLVAHAYNPSYSGDTDQEDHSLRLAPGKQLLRPYLENTQHKKGLMEWLKC